MAFLTDIIKPVKDTFQPKAYSKVKVDNSLFWFFYRATVALHVLFVFILGGKAYFGDPIDCALRKTDVPGNMIDNYCWVSGTWTVRDKRPHEIDPNDGKARKVWNIHPSVGIFDERYHKKIYHTYYQWVPLMLGLSAGIFYLPKLIWNRYEKGLMKDMCEEINAEGKAVEGHNMKRRTVDDGKTVKRLEQLLKHHLRGDWHRQYVIRLVFCEALNIFSTAAVWCLTNRFLEYRFETYGGDIYKFWNDLMTIGTIEPINNIEKYGPHDAVFPKVTKCDFHTFGYSGTQQRHDALCVLMLNVINEKVYIVLWYWYILAFVLGAVMIIKRLLLLIPDIFMYTMYPTVPRFENARIKMIKRLRLNQSPWKLFVLRQVSQNVDPPTWELLIECLADNKELTVEEIKEKMKQRDSQRKMEEGDIYSFNTNPKITSERVSLSDYGTLQAKPGDSNMNNYRLNMTLASNRKSKQYDTPPRKQSNSFSSQETTLDVGEEFVMAMDNPIDNQKNFDTTLKIGDVAKKKY